MGQVGVTKGIDPSEHMALEDKLLGEISCSSLKKLLLIVVSVEVQIDEWNFFIHLAVYSTIFLIN